MARRAIAVLATGLALGGCATSALRSFVGGDVNAVTARYGPPSSQSHLPDGTESFQWVVAAKRTAVTAAPLTTFLPLKTAPLDKRIAASSAGLLLGGMCVYTLIARRDGAAGSWKVVGYRTPRIDCN